MLASRFSSTTVVKTKSSHPDILQKGKEFFSTHCRNISKFLAFLNVKKYQIKFKIVICEQKIVLYF